MSKPLIQTFLISATTLSTIGNASYDPSIYYPEYHYKEKLVESNKLHNGTFTPKQNSNKITELQAKLKNYLLLPDNWDGYEGKAPSIDVVETCLSFIDHLIYNSITLPKAMLSGSGEISLYWENENSYIELGFEERNSYTYYANVNGKIFGDDDYSLTNGEPIPENLLDTLRTI